VFTHRADEYSGKIICFYIPLSGSGITGNIMSFSTGDVYNSSLRRLPPSGPFLRSLRSLEGDRFLRSAFKLSFVVLVLAGWLTWAFLARVSVYTVSDSARLEVAAEVHPVESPTTGPVVAVHMVVGQQVKSGQVLVELENEPDRLRLNEQQTRHDTLALQQDALLRRVEAEETTIADLRLSSQAAIEEAQARYDQAEAAALFAGEQARRMLRLHASGLVPEVEMMRANAEATQHNSAATALKLAITRLDKDRKTREDEHRTRIEQLKQELASIQGASRIERAAIGRIEHDMQRRQIRAPIDGQLGEVANLRAGSMVREADKIATVIPNGSLRVIAEFLPQEALGRIYQGQTARLRLDGFPWTQYGSIRATVVNRASEARDGRVRVELAAHLDPASAIPFQHGMPGSVEIEVERISPAKLVLRAVGKWVGASSNAMTDSGGNDR